MKIGLDFDKKEITLEKSVNLEKFLKVIKKILPKGEWKKFKLNTQTTINYSYPIYYTYTYDWILKQDSYPGWYVTWDTNNVTDNFSPVHDTLTTDGDGTVNIYNSSNTTVGMNKNVSTDTVNIGKQMIVEVN